MNRRQLLRAAAGWSAPLATGLALAQPYPGRPVTIIVASAAGGPLDVAARMLSQYLADLWKTPVVVDHRPGAGGTIAAATVARSAPDGYTLLLATRAVTINPSLYEKLPFDTSIDLAPVAMVNEQPNLLVVSKSFPAHNLSELLKLVKQEPGKYSFGSPGNGGIPHMAGVMFMRSTGTRLIHVPYRGAGPLMNDLLAGRIHMTFASPGTVVSHLADGRVLPIAIASPKRSPLAPNVPTLAELGVKDVNITSWYGLFAPAKTPTAVVQKINADVVAYLKTPAGVAKISAQGAQPTPISVEEFNGEFQRDIVSFAGLLKGMNIKAD